MGFYTEELKSLNLDELEQQFDRDGNYDDYYEEVAEQIVAHGEPGLVYLRRIVEEACIDEPQLCAAIWVLSLQPEGPWYREKLRTLLQDSRGQVVASAVGGLARISARDLSETVLRLQTHPSPYARAGVLVYMSRLFPNEAPPLLIAALKDAHPIVRESAIDELDDLGYYQALPAIRPLLYDQPDPVRQAARTAVKNLTVLRKDASRTSPDS
ncbi:MAG: HEAT repeat domain-containing protein [Ktedonobacteraceae bacterium]|nr:HEAT repeat domain-containing protein [Ktedonobacteraceae bacterium]